MKILNIDSVQNSTNNSWRQDVGYFLQQSTKNNDKIIKVTQDIIDDIKENGDSSLINYCNKFDETGFDNISQILVTDDEIKDAKSQIDENLQQALHHSYKRIESYHKKQLPQNILYDDDAGLTLGNKWQSLKKVGVYAPGGSASYPSSVLMSAVPAIVAGVDEISLFTPAKNNIINPAILYAASLCNIKKIYKVGGAQAIAAMAYGTNIIDKVDKIVGPGNSYVAMAKKLVFGDVGIDMIAGPTDLTIIAESKHAKAAWVAADALSQLEHGEDSKVFIITDDYQFSCQIIDEIEHLSKQLDRKKIIQSSLKKSAIFVINNIKDAALISNFIAPEHLEIISQYEDIILKNITNAGAIFLGNYSPEAIGDYIAGPSHTLPTEGTARFSSGLSVFDFLKRISIIKCPKESFNKISNFAALIAKNEGLDAHKLSLTIRNDEI